MFDFIDRIAWALAQSPRIVGCALVYHYNREAYNEWEKKIKMEIKYDCERRFPDYTWEIE